MAALITEPASWRDLATDVRVIATQFVRPFVKSSKNDEADAAAIWEVAQRSGMRLAVKTEDQEAVLAMRRIRQQLVRIRAMQVNPLRGLLFEFGVVIQTLLGGRDTLLTIVVLMRCMIVPFCAAAQRLAHYTKIGQRQAAF